MRELKTERILKILFSTMLLVLTSCSSVKVQNTELCAVAGRLKAGADCAHTLSDETRSMSMNEFITFLEPQQEVKDVKTGKVMQEGRGAALCQSSADFNANKTALEQACYLLKSSCTYEIKAAIKKMSDNSAALIEKSKTSTTK